MRPERTLRHTLVLAVVIGVVLGTLPGLVLAQSGSGVGGTIVVEEGETVDEVDGIAGNVIVDGTVRGDVRGVAGNVYVNGEVGGDVDVFGGNLEITGTVDGDVDSASGNVVVAENATVGGEVSVAAGNVDVFGTIEGDASIAAETIRLGDAASIGGDLTYAGTLVGDTDAVAGEVREDTSIGNVTGLETLPSLEPILGLYALVLNLLLGALLLALFPRFSDGVVDRVSTEPVKTGLVGLAVLVGVPIVLVAIAITIIGIPITIVGAFAFAFLVWVGIVYGRFAVAAWLLAQVDVDNRWLALVVGLVSAALLAQVPIVGDFLNFLVFLLGLGALAGGLYALRGRRPETPTAAEPGEPTAD
ncbi:bactofilin family protein [Natrialbaceae archaeon AArc-T1-2]|uniref:bactofilin family protein n=1 Tax=Natrialbaceae archaeon AArc-T1-2 TaxID=3053904 RepID=UPI003D2F99EC